MTDKLPEDKISPTFCIAPWSSIATATSGGYKPCCWIFDACHDSLSEYITSDYLTDIKDTMLAGEWHHLCKRCKIEESSGITSKRKRENASWLKTFNKLDFTNYEDYPLSNLDLRLSNTCNLLCISCNPKSSSSIYHETHANYKNTVHHYNDLYDKMKKSGVNSADVYSDEEIDKLISGINKHTTIYFAGGEPSLIKQGFVILNKLIEDELNKHVTLKFSSNFQVFNAQWVDLLSQFSGIMSPSLDAVGPRAEFIRYGSDWNKIEDNFKNFYNQCNESYIIDIIPTISILNIFYLHELIDWTRQFNIKNVIMEFSNRLNAPRFLCVRNLPEDAKIDAISYLNNLINSSTVNLREKEKTQLIELIKYIKQPALNIMPGVNFVTEMNKLDKIRNTSWREQLPELSKYYEY